MRIAPQGAIAFYAKAYFKKKLAEREQTGGPVAISSVLEFVVNLRIPTGSYTSHNCTWTVQGFLD